MLAFRFANIFVEAFWNRHYIESVEITMAEDFGVQGRGGLNLTMEPPVRSDSDSLRDEKVKVLKAIPPIEEKNLVRGQFRGYRNENGVAKDSQTETFAALKAEINSWRWKGVPFYIRAGKCLPTTCTEIVGGWQFGGVWILHTGLPFTVVNTASFSPICSGNATPVNGGCPAGSTIVGNSGGDYNADGNNMDIPDVPSFGRHLCGKHKEDFLAEFLAHQQVALLRHIFRHLPLERKGTLVGTPTTTRDTITSISPPKKCSRLTS